ncbi:HEPN domain-containing protein [Burkholderia gladioli]|uniref:HEPN domain-containing protein n=1 Tax=Burkholderia gladioli TaxID=28095 RepID=UPI0016408191|nr:HEPN domain-containing protein [Burkholderia gladioli]
MANPLSVDTTPVPTPSSSAVVVRNGCMVMMFCALEGFVRDRSLECATAIDQTTVPYTHLPVGLKVASLIATFEGLANLPRSMPVADKLSEFEQAASAVAAGSLGSPYQFTRYSFARDKSNVGADDISTIAKRFGVSNFWNAAGTVCLKAGIAVQGNFDELFKQLAIERHKAAHVSTHSVPHARLSAFVWDTLACALAFDALLSTATMKLSTSQIATGIAPAAVTGADVDFLAVKPRPDGRWAAVLPQKTKALFLEPTREAALARAVQVSTTRKLSIICHDNAGRASAWRSLIG